MSMVRAEHFYVLQKQGIEIEESYLPDIPKESYYLFSIWQDMNSERPNYGMGPSAISSKMVYDYFAVLYGCEPMSLEIKIIKTIDSEYLEAVHGRYSKSSN